MTGADLICAVLGQLGVSTVFGLPGTQNIVLYEAMRRAGLRSVTASDEGAAAFMANGYARASGRVGVLTTIPGPGFVYALSGIAEAHQDSVPLVWLTLRQPDDGLAYPLQRIDQPAMAAPVVKQCFLVERVEELAECLLSGYREALSGEPGPVLIEVAANLLVQPSPASPPGASWAAEASIAPQSFVECARAAARPLVFAGQGAQGAAAEVQELVRRWRAPVLFTSSGRGVLPDADPLAFVQDFSCGVGKLIPDLIERADLILALGCKFTHNGSAAGRLRLPAEKLLRVDASRQVLASNYPAKVAVCAHVEEVVPALLRAGIPPSQWPNEEISDIRARLLREREQPIQHEPTIATGNSRTSFVRLFEAMSQAFGRDVIYTADAGLHQVLVRRYAKVVSARGLLCPSDFQSMGFGLPGAIGAALARPDATIVACVGDGAFTLSLGDMLTAVRVAANLVVVVFNDGAYGLIRRQQLMNFGRPADTSLLNPDYSALAAAIGCSHFPVMGDLDELMNAVARTPGVRLVEVRMNETASLARHALRSGVREGLSRSLPDGARKFLKQALRR